MTGQPDLRIASAQTRKRGLRHLKATCQQLQWLTLLTPALRDHWNTRGRAGPRPQGCCFFRQAADVAVRAQH